MSGDVTHHSSLAQISLPSPPHAPHACSCDTRQRERENVEQKGAYRRHRRCWVPILGPWIPRRGTRRNEARRKDVDEIV